MPKIKNIETEVYITFGLLKEQKEKLKKEADEKDISIGKLVRRKLFPRNKKIKNN